MFLHLQMKAANYENFRMGSIVSKKTGLDSG